MGRKKQRNDKTTQNESGNERRIGRKLGSVTWSDQFMAGQKKKRVEENEYVGIEQKKRQG